MATVLLNELIRKFEIHHIINAQKMQLEKLWPEGSYNPHDFTRRDCDCTFLLKVFDNILHHTNHNHSIEVSRLYYEVDDYILCLQYLHKAGFEGSINDRKLIWINNANNIDTIKLLSTAVILCCILFHESHSLTDELIDSVRFLNRFEFPHEDHWAEKMVQKDQDSCNVSQCLYLKSIINVLRKYRSYIDRAYNEQKIQCIDTDVYQQIGNQYNYVDLLNDFNHLLQYHGDEFEEIYNILNHQIYNNNGCKLGKCLSMRRHHRDRCRKTKNEKLLNELYNMNDNIVSQQLLDRVHCHYMHTFDVGYRLLRDDMAKIEEMINCQILLEEIVDGNTFDPILKAITKYLKPRQNAMRNSDDLDSRFSTKINDFNNTIRYSFGYRFFYWKCFKNCAEVYDLSRYIHHWHKIQANEGSFLGHFYIEPKYPNLKEEILTNPICCLSSTKWQRLIQKAKAHIDTEYYRKFRCQHDQGEYFFNIPYYSPIKIDHIVAMMLYCNFDLLSFNFGKTFRHESEDETIPALIKRHRNYANMGRLLRECVDCYGSLEIGGIPFAWTRRLRVFHGFTIESQFCSVDAFIKGPVSTSTDFAVASAFSGNQGMILEFRFDMFWHIAQWNTGLSLFDCCYVSDYPNEQEIFFIGGHSRFTFETIINLPKGINYTVYVKALGYISDFCAGSYKYEGPIKEQLSKSERQTCFRIFSHQLYKQHPSNEEYHPLLNLDGYVAKLIDNHFQHISKFSMNIANIQMGCLKKIISYYFVKSNGMLNLHLLTKIFPRVTQVIFGIEEDKLETFLEELSTFASLREWINETYLERILIKLPRQENVFYKCLNLVKNLKQTLRSFLWDIYINIEDKYKDYRKKYGVKTVESFTIVLEGALFQRRTSRFTNELLEATDMKDEQSRINRHTEKLMKIISESDIKDIANCVSWEQVQSTDYLEFPRRNIMGYDSDLNQSIKQLALKYLNHVNQSS